MTTVPTSAALITPLRSQSRLVKARIANARPVGPATRFDIGTTFLSWSICSIAIVWALSASSNCTHWFIIPVFFGGVLISLDMVDWLRGRFNVFDPVGLLGVFGFHIFFLAPLLHVVWDWWFTDRTIRIADLRPWMGWMAILNLIGLIIYRYTRDRLAGSLAARPRRVWLLNESVFWPALIVMLLVSAVLQAGLYISWGGIMGYIRGVENQLAAHGLDKAAVYAVSESFPLLLMMGYCVLARRNKFLSSWGMLAAMMVTYLVLTMLFGGLRGARSNTVWAVFWAVGMVHFFVRPVPKRIIFTGAFVLFAFMYVYGFFKSGGIQAISALESGEADVGYLERKTQRTTAVILLGDFARTETQAFILRQLNNKELEYDLALGRTYLATICRIIPSYIWQSRPLLKDLEGTEIQYGKGTYDPVARKSSLVYGAAGEAMLNFGPAVVPFVFLIWALFVGRIRKWILSWNPADVRVLLAPWLIIMCFVMFIGDSDNVFYSLFKYGLVPVTFLWLCSNHVANANRSASAALRGALPGRMQRVGPPQVA